MIRAMEGVAHLAMEQAGALIREKMGKISSSDIHTKGISDYVTQVDMESERIITGIIEKHFPRHHIMAEETENDGMHEGFTWVIDPIDGTANFIHGFPFVAISIAVCENREPILGFVLDPVRNECFTARKGGGAFLNGHPIQMRSTEDLGETMIATGFPHRTRDIIDPYLEVFKRVFLQTSGIRRAGAAALDLAYLAAGRVDGFWEAGLKAWDIAAGALLVHEAGGIVTDFWGEENYLENGHIVGGSSLTHPFLLEQVKTFLVPALASRAGVKK
ncbi:inositol monophosphatase family protein [Desulforhabdus amnigena]|uniref:Inositol-1-monophosphatase n=1 Tax=Desulforhabdus amnigena TaxID=40218 RepID=A0A9W6FWQ0_9BACT|nr:inositol monophosphatase family protein [Desulforhabdus amnigena]GLI36228.1 inositol monophosphatase [Desulforhabdus amnigena]